MDLPITHFAVTDEGIYVMSNKMIRSYIAKAEHPNEYHELLQMLEAKASVHTSNMS